MKTTVYVVQNGDTLLSIAQRFCTDVKTIAGFNGITDPDRISEGQILRIPLGCESEEVFRTYTVEKGDTLYSISKMFDTDVNVLARLNGIPDPDYIEAGRVLRVPVTSAPESIRIYIVKDGDTLYEIGKRFGYGIDELAAYNDISNPDLIKIGQVIRFPNTSGGDYEDGVYTVKSGDTLWQIAEKFNIPFAELININMITNPDMIYPGQKLRVVVS